MNGNLNFLTVQVHSVEVLDSISRLVLPSKLNEHVALRLVTDVVTRNLDAFNITIALKVASHLAFAEIFLILVIKKTLDADFTVSAVTNGSSICSRGGTTSVLLVGPLPICRPIIGGLTCNWIVRHGRLLRLLLGVLRGYRRPILLRL